MERKANIIIITWVALVDLSIHTRIDREIIRGEQENDRIDY